jgi:hypothetical protein
VNALGSVAFGATAERAAKVALVVTAGLGTFEEVSTVAAKTLAAMVLAAAVAADSGWEIEVATKVASMVAPLQEACRVMAEGVTRKYLSHHKIRWIIHQSKRVLTNDMRCCHSFQHYSI